MSDEPYSDTYVQLEGCQIEALREQNRALREVLKDVLSNKKGVPGSSRGPHGHIA